jgi:hypothetical protein
MKLGLGEHAEVEAGEEPRVTPDDPIRFGAIGGQCRGLGCERRYFLPQLAQ